MRKRKIIREGRKALLRQYDQLGEITDATPEDATRFVEELPLEHVLHAGMIAVGSSQITRERGARTVSPNYVVGSHAAPYLANTVRVSPPTEAEALAAFYKKQRDDKWMAGIGAGAIGLIAAGAALGALCDFSHENTDLYSPPATSTPLPHHTSDPTRIQSTMPGYEQTPITTATPVTPPTSFDFHH